MTPTVIRAWVLVVGANLILAIYAHMILALQGWAMLAALVVQAYFGWLCGGGLFVETNRMKGDDDDKSARG